VTVAIYSEPMSREVGATRASLEPSQTGVPTEMHRPGAHVTEGYRWDLPTEEDGAITRPGVGGLTEVERVGETVRRAAGPWTPAVHALLSHLARVGFDGAPRPLRIDAAGREVLTFVVGGGPSHGDEELARVARLIRAFHEAAASSMLRLTPNGSSWLGRLEQVRSSVTTIFLLTTRSTETTKRRALSSIGTWPLLGRGSGTSRGRSTDSCRSTTTKPVRAWGTRSGHVLHGCASSVTPIGSMLAKHSSRRSVNAFGSCTTPLVRGVRTDAPAGARSGEPRVASSGWTDSATSRLNVTSGSENSELTSGLARLRQRPRMTHEPRASPGCQDVRLGRKARELCPVARCGISAGELEAAGRWLSPN
jgi:hypothetical protein